LGEGIEQNYEKAYEYFSKAAEMHLVSAERRLGFLIEWGKGLFFSFSC